ncbi:MAG: DUF433 domain-containing protein [Polaromonas sp.]|nr:DUF433 domain-containing protein [Polaromonas sp.]
MGWTPPLSLDEGLRRVCVKLLAGFDAKSITDMMIGANMNRITLEPGKRGGRPCIRGLRITVYDVLSMLSTNMTQQEILEDFPELEPEDILAALAFAADREHKVYSLAVQ